MDEEKWRDIKGYEGLYQVSNYGRIKSFKHKKIRILKTVINKYGYERVILCKNNQNKNFSVHRLVAIAFIHNPNNYPQVNHKDENKSNNYVDNLEWCTRSYNCCYGNRNKKIAEKMKIINKGKHYSPRTEFKKGENVKKVKCIELNKTYNSIIEASKELNISSGNITNVCKKKKYNKTAGGYRWEYC